VLAKKIDNCKTWYHFSCVREESANNLKGWTCPPCEKGDTDIVKTNTTAQPRRDCKKSRK